MINAKYPKTDITERNKEKERNPLFFCSFSLCCSLTKGKELKVTQITQNCAWDKSNSHTVQRSAITASRNDAHFSPAKPSLPHTSFTFYRVIHFTDASTQTDRIQPKDKAANEKINLSTGKEHLQNIHSLFLYLIQQRVGLILWNVYVLAYITAATNRRFLTSLSPLEVNKIKKCSLLCYRESAESASVPSWRLSCSRKTEL